MDFDTVKTDELAKKLRKFYCEAKPIDTNKFNTYEQYGSWYQIKSAITPFRRYRVWSLTNCMVISQYNSKNDILFIKWYHS